MVGVEAVKKAAKGRHMRFEHSDDDDETAPGDSNKVAEVTKRWFEHASCDMTCRETMEACAELSSWDSRAEQLLQSKCSLPNSGGWLGNVASSGTLSDRVAAAGVLIARNPLTSLSQLDLLLQKVNKKNRREALVASEVVRDLFIQELLPDRKLIPFRSRPFDQIALVHGEPSPTCSEWLVNWKFEGELKSRYAAFVRAIQAISHDPLSTVRTKACKILADLLCAKAEQEQAILPALVDKLGDTDAQVASKVIRMLERLVKQHPNMRTVLVAEVEKLIYRQNVSTKAQFYAICFLITIPLQSVDCELAKKLVNIYFDLLKLLLGKDQVAEEQRMTRQILYGVNKALPHVVDSMTQLADQIDQLYKMAATSALSVSFLTLSIVYQLLSAAQSVDDRFYRSLYKKMADPGLGESSPQVQAIFFHLLLKSMTVDKVMSRVRAFCKRLLQLCTMATGAFACASLFILSKVQQRRRESIVNVSGGWAYDQDEDEDSTAYDPSARDAQYAHADNEPMYELLSLKNHYHPTVALFAQKVLKEESIDYSGDPLNDFSMMHFLDRFVFKKPKVERNDAIVRKQRAYDPWAVRSMDVLSEKYAQTNAKHIPPDELYIHTWSRLEQKRKSRTADQLKIDFSRDIDEKSGPKRKVTKRRREESDSDNSSCSSENVPFHAAEQFGELLEEDDPRPAKKPSHFNRKKRINKRRK